MSQQDLFRTIQIQQAQLSQLREQLAHSENFEARYKKALKQITGIIKANRQLKDELDRLNAFLINRDESSSNINKQELGKAYQKLLKEKNQMIGEKESLLSQNQKLRYSLAALEQNFAKLKSEKMQLARQKQGMAKVYEKSSEGSNEKLKDKDLRQKQADFRKTLENYEERHSSLTRNNRKLEEQISELQNKLFNQETEFKNKLNEKDIEVKVSKSSAREEYQSQIATLKKEVSQLKIINNELTVRSSLVNENQQLKISKSSEQEERLIETLRDLKLQLEPMSLQIAELQGRNQSDKEDAQRQKANLQIKVMEYEAEIDRLRENQKLLEKKLIKDSERSRRQEDLERSVKKLEQQNRMMGGRIIVLQAKQVALRNRSGDELEQRVMEFQTRVQMLLSDKEAIANMKNIGIHQLIALKAYIMELDAKLKQVVNQNEYAVKKYKSYKQKCTQLIRELKQHDIAINALKGKLQGYDRLVVKLQGELERAITINDNQMKSINMKITQSTINSIDIYKKRYQSLLEKLSLQEKYAEQEVQTLKLNYDTKILDLNLKLEELQSMKQTIGLYKSKNEELSNKLTQKENELLETKMTKVIISEAVLQPKNPHKQVVNKLHETINLKQSTIISLENQIRKTQQEWKGKYSQLQLNTNATLSKKNREDEDKKREIEHLESQIRAYRNKIGELESKTANIPFRAEEDDHRKSHNFNGQISDLQVQLEDFRNRYEIETAKTAKLAKVNVELKQTNNDLESEVSKLRFQIKRVEKELRLELEDKQSQLKRLQSKNQQNLSESRRYQKPESDDSFKVNSLKMGLQMLQGQLEQVEKQKAKYYNRTIQLEKQSSELEMKIEELNYNFERTKNNMNTDLAYKQAQRQQQIQKLQYAVRSQKDKIADLQAHIPEYESEIARTRNELNRERQRIVGEIDRKDDEISKLVRELNKARSDISNQDEVKSGISQQYEYKINRIISQNNNMRDELQEAQNNILKYESEIKFFRNRELQYNSKAESQQDYLTKLSSELRNFQNKETELESQILEKQSTISKLTSELSYIKSQITSIEQTIDAKEAQIARLNSENSSLRNQQIEWQIETSSRATDVNRLNSDLQYARSKINDLELDLDSARAEISRIKSANLANDHNFSIHIEELEERDNTIQRLQAEVRSKNDQIHELTFQLDTKSSKISELQNQSLRLRSLSTETETELIEKSSQISRLTYELNNLRVKYQNLESEFESSDGNIISINRELARIQQEANTYADDLLIKSGQLDRFKGQIGVLTEQIETLNTQIYEKQKTINNLNQELFQLKLENEEKSTDKIYKLENQIYQLKSKVNSLESELEYKEGELGRARMEVSSIRSTITVNRYTDEEYDLLQAQFYQVQRSLSETRSQLSEKQFEVTQLETKVESFKRQETDYKRRFAEERHDLQTELQNVLSRQRSLRNQISDLEGEAMLSQNRGNDEQQWGLQLYQNECDRLQKIVQELQDEVNGLKLKLTYMTNQEDRIVQNLTIMTLTFAEVEALRDRIKVKQHQISEVRKSLINFATSSEEVTSMGSRLVVKDKVSTSRSKQNLEAQHKSSIEDIESNGTYNYQGGNSSYKPLFSHYSSEANNIAYISKAEYGRAEPTQNWYRMDDYKYNEGPAESYKPNSRDQYNYESSQGYANYTQRKQNRSQAYGSLNEQKSFKPTETADRKLTDLVNSMTGNKDQRGWFNEAQHDQPARDNNVMQSFTNERAAIKTDQSLDQQIKQGLYNMAEGSQSDTTRTQVYNRDGHQQQKPQLSLQLQHQQITQVQQPAQGGQRESALSNAQQQSQPQQQAQPQPQLQAQLTPQQLFQNQTVTAQSQQLKAQQQKVGETSLSVDYLANSISQAGHSLSNQTTQSLSQQPSWRYGSSQNQGTSSISSSLNSAILIQGAPVAKQQPQPPFQQQPQPQPQSQPQPQPQFHPQGPQYQTSVPQYRPNQQITIGGTSVNSTSSIKPVSPSPGLQSFGSTGQIVIKGGQQVQSRQYGVFQQPLQYPGFGR